MIAMVADAPGGRRGQAPSRRWATPWAWAAHRNTITRLYMHEGHTLPEVARIMRQDHDFYSSPRMFKDRFRRWGLHKYRSHRHGVEISQESTGKAIPSSLTSPALPLRLEPPETFRVAEAIVRLTEALLACELARGAVFLRDSYGSFAAVDSSAWCRGMRSSATLIALGEHHEGFQALNHCLDSCRRLLQTPSLDLFAKLLVVLLLLPSEVAKRLLVFITSMASLSLPLGHPLRLMWTTLSTTGYRDLWNNAWLILWSHLAVLKRRLGITHPMVLNLCTELSDSIMLLHNERRLQIDLGAFMTEQRALVKARQEIGDDFNLALAQLCSAYHSWRRGDLAAADAIAKKAFVQCSADGSPLDRLSCYALEIQWLVAMENYDVRRRAPGPPHLLTAEKERLFGVALRLGRENARLQLLQYGRDTAPIREVAARMRAFCKKAGRPDAVNSTTFL